MARQYISMENLRFLLYEVHEIDKLTAYEHYSHVGGKEEIELLINAAKDIADREMFPFFKEMDTVPVVHKGGKIHSHPQLKNIFKAVGDAGWFSSISKLEDGGMQLPFSVYSAAHLIFEAANSSAQGYLGVSTGALELIETFGNERLKKEYLPQMMSGNWQGTMALTEPQAGSSLSDITTSAAPTGDAYTITGQKIFISAGEHEACENFVHLTLARIKGAPAGTKGISLFVVPKFLKNEKAELIYNHVMCVADFQKMGQRGYSTTHLIFGESGATQGFLVGEANKGLSYMFMMMNSARIAVGQTAAAVASAAYYYALQYANERPQGRYIADKDLTKSQTLIINHADVRRMLLQQKAFVEGSLGLVVECLKWYDLEKVVEGEEKTNALLLLEILTPIVKAYPTEAGIVSVNNALQVFGGYGYTMDFDVQQYYRDIRIMSLYEGTTGIQSMDLLGRKIPMQNGKGFQLLINEIQKTIDAAKEFAALATYSNRCKEAVEDMQNALQYLQSFAKKGEVELYMADATMFMEMCGIITVAWQWLKQAVIAQKTLVSEENKAQTKLFYKSKLETMKFFYKYELPKTVALAQTLMHQDKVTIKTDEEILM